ncbi:MAG TPA: RNA-binding domain-containing protein [Methanomassiliicoccales archaeon]|nr:RNA-binding domain-containing protein [Methanomassiliicoccales archaeon]
MALVTITASCYPTEDPAKVERAVLNLFPGSEVGRSADAIVARTGSLERFKELVRNYRILDATRAMMLRGAQGHRTEFSLNKQAAFSGKVSFLEGRVALGGIRVQIEDQDLESLIEEVAPVTVNGEEVSR